MPSTSVLVKIHGCANPYHFCIVDGILDKGGESVSVVGGDVDCDRVNCQLYGGWRLGKRKKWGIPEREGLIQAVGENID